MLVATFGETTGWAGRTITFADETFVLEGHGVIDAVGVLSYDTGGYLVWPFEEMRGWVRARAEWQAAMERPASPATEPQSIVRDLLLPGGDLVEVAGESHYQEALVAITGGKTETSVSLERWAVLLPEPDNPYDRNAVAVYIDGSKVGYLPRDDAAEYVPLLQALWQHHQARGVCYARIIGGWRIERGGRVDEGHYGVQLGLASPDEVLAQQTLTALSPEELAAGPRPI